MKQKLIAVIAAAMLLAYVPTVSAENLLYLEQAAAVAEDVYAENIDAN